ncbi:MULTISPECIES: hypothetical protein [Photorhabdus]|uniref:Uncharacterized protein n=2 Tax=Photorhabdus TaxID=29487 RepID=A0ABX0B6Y8_9GAMM|nr:MULTISPECIES: hypothetical protein [Photorhabdus]MCC8376598.1 hypothetical protein [Photorhabdus bodei]MCT8352037.1 hypothetical protein [Photorhabdus kayaii]MDB6371153.1 hypothetical protein [Photorhabdus bodei]NDL13389.1 hypothetical protein [Photorhabdus kayaii]NDL27123.1 hypothetical protein [Photorhabdus kayaii]
MTGVSECSQQRGNLKDDGYIQLNDYRNKNNHNNYFMKKSVIAGNKVLN